MMKTTRLLLVALASTSFALISCSDDTSCSSASDCFLGESCTEGQCVGESANNDSAAPDAGQPDDVGPQEMGTDTGSPSDVGDDGGDEGDGDAGGEMDAMEPDDTCVVDPFEVDACTPDDNDRFAERFVEPTVGCQDQGYVGLDETRTERFCSQEDADLYTVSIIECEERGQILEVRLTPLVSCSPELVNIEVSLGGLRCSEQESSTDITCGWQADGSYLAQLVVAEGLSITSARIEIDTDPRTDIDFDYDLQVKLR